MITRRCHKSIAGSLSIVLLAVFVLAGCAGQLKPAAYLDRGFKPESIGQIAMLPAVDGRIDKDAKVNLEDELREEAAKILRDKGYDVVMSNAPGETAGLTYHDFRAADTALIKRLGPPSARWVMVVALVYLKGQAKVQGFLYDKVNGTLVWQDNGTGVVEIGPAYNIGTVLAAALIYQAEKASGATSARRAVDNLLASIPERGH